MKKLFGVVLILLAVLVVAAGAGAWKVRQLADSKILIKDETILTLPAGTGRTTPGELLYPE